LDFNIFLILTADMVKIMKIRHRPNLVAIDQTVVEIWRFFYFPRWICDVRVRTTHEGHLVILINVRNLVGINFDKMQVLIFCVLGLQTPKRIFTTTKWGVGSEHSSTLSFTNDMPRFTLLDTLLKTSATKLYQWINQRHNTVSKKSPPLNCL